MSVTAGVLIFAHGEKYLRLATIARAYISQHLNLPVTLITSETVTNFLKDWHKIIQVDKPAHNTSPHGIKEWYNRDRLRAYELSPYELTYVIDADITLHSDSLAWPHQYCHSEQPDWFLTQGLVDAFTGDAVGAEVLGTTKIPMRYASIMLFYKYNSAPLFELAQHIEKNWRFYAEWYGFDPRHYRNDIAFTIADWTLNGKTSGPALPPLSCIGDTTRVVSMMTFDGVSFTNVLDMLSKNKPHTIIDKTNLHWVAKDVLLDYMPKPFVYYVPDIM